VVGEEVIDEILSELLCVQDLAREIDELVEKARGGYEAGELELSEDFFRAILSDISAMKSCASRAMELWKGARK
jgi:hypothetical protein